jgi:hypothetical protein
MECLCTALNTRTVSNSLEVVPLLAREIMLLDQKNDRTEPGNLSYDKLPIFVQPYFDEKIKLPSIMTYKEK